LLISGIRVVAYLIPSDELERTAAVDAQHHPHPRRVD